MSTTKPTGPGAGAQLVLDLGLRPAMGREDFLVAPSNEAAVAAIDRWPDWPAPVLVLVGPAGSGKTHLAEVWRTRCDAARIAANDLDEDMVKALGEAGTVILEDAPGPALNERALFHLVNHLRELGGYLLITSRSYPAQWAIALPDLATRLKAAAVTALSAPDDMLLRGVLVKLFQDRQIAVDEALISYMIARMERSMEAARTLVEEIDRRALAARAPVTRRFAGRVMDELSAPGEPDEE